MHNSASVLKNETHKLLRVFEKQTDHVNTIIPPDIVRVNKTKRICWIVDFYFLADHEVKLKGSEKKDKYLYPARKLIKTMEHESDQLYTGTGGLGYKRSRDHPNAIIYIYISHLVCNKHNKWDSDHNTQLYIYIIKEVINQIEILLLCCLYIDCSQLVSI